VDLSLKINASSLKQVDPLSLSAPTPHVVASMAAVQSNALLSNGVPMNLKMLVAFIASSLSSNHNANL